MPSWRQRMLPVVRNMGVIYVCILASLFIIQDKLIFVGSMMGTVEDDIELPPQFKILRLSRKLKRRPLENDDDDEDDDETPRFRVVKCDPRKIIQQKIKGVLLFFGGNAEGMAGLINRAATFSEYGLVVFAAEYPGYGLSAGPPNLSTFMLQAEVIGQYSRAYAKQLKVPLFVAGSSLGTFSATHIAELGYGERLLLHAPLLSMEEVAKSLYWYVPVSLALSSSYRFDNKASALEIRRRRPKPRPDKRPYGLIIHGTTDELVPSYNGEQLAELMGPQVDLVLAEGYGHNDVDLRASGRFGALIRVFFFPDEDPGSR